MNINNAKLALGLGTAGIGATAVIIESIDGSNNLKRADKQRESLTKNIKGNSKKKRQQRMQINKDFAEEKKEINNRHDLAIAGTIAATGLSEVGIMTLMKR